MFTWFMNPFSWSSWASVLSVVVNSRVSKFHHHEIRFSGYSNVWAREVCQEGRNLSWGLVLRCDSWVVSVLCPVFYAFPVWDRSPCYVLLLQSQFFHFSPTSSSKNSLLKRISNSREAYWGKMSVLSSSASRPWSWPLPYQHSALEKRSNSLWNACVCHGPYSHI